MVIDVLVAGGKHLGGGLAAVRSDLERDYGNFVWFNDDATLERVDDNTGKVGCAVTFGADLEGMAKRVLEKGATGRAQILIQRIAKEGRTIGNRITYTIQETSGGSYMVAFGLPKITTSPSPRPSRRSSRQHFGGCLVKHHGHCLIRTGR